MLPNVPERSQAAMLLAACPHPCAACSFIHRYGSVHGGSNMKLSSMFVPVAALTLLVGASSAHADALAWSTFLLPASNVGECTMLAARVARKHQFNVFAERSGAVEAEAPGASVVVKCIGPVPDGAVAVLVVTGSYSGQVHGVHDSLRDHLIREACAGRC
jgi:hypothetical protein